MSVQLQNPAGQYYNLASGSFGKSGTKFSLIQGAGDMIALQYDGKYLAWNNGTPILVDAPYYFPANTLSNMGLSISSKTESIKIANSARFGWSVASIIFGILFIVAVIVYWWMLFNRDTKLIDNKTPNNIIWMHFGIIMALEFAAIIFIGWGSAWLGRYKSGK